MHLATYEHTQKKKNRIRLIVFIAVLGLLLLASNKAAKPPTGSTRVASVQLPPTKLKVEASTSFVRLVPNNTKPLIYAKNYVLMDAATGDIVVSQNPDDLIPIASTTKMSTALTAVEKLDMSKVVTISKKPPTIQGSKINLLSGEKITVDNLVRGMLISSGNDAAFALAEAYSGTEGDYQTFVKEINLLLRTKGLTKTQIADPAGLDDEQGRSTARELAHIARLLLQNDFLATIVSTPQITISSVDGALRHDLKNTNRLIQADSGYYLPNAIGVKTGFTLDAGHSLVSAYKLDGRVLIGVVMNTTESTNVASAAEMKKLFMWAERNVIKTTYAQFGSK